MGGTGDVTSVGSGAGACTGGDCLDGSSDGGSSITLYNSGGNTIITAGSGTVDFSVPITATSFTADASATPSIDLNDSDTTVETVP